MVTDRFWQEEMGSFCALLCLPLPALDAPGKRLRPRRGNLGRQVLCCVYRNCGEKTSVLLNQGDFPAEGKFPSHVGSPVSV